MTTAASGFTGLTGEHSSGPRSRPGLAELSCLVLREVLVVELGTRSPCIGSCSPMGALKGRLSAQIVVLAHPCAQHRLKLQVPTVSFRRRSCCSNFCSTNETPSPLQPTLLRLVLGHGALPFSLRPPFSGWLCVLEGEGPSHHQHSQDTPLTRRCRHLFKNTSN